MSLQQRLLEYGLYLRGITAVTAEEVETYQFPVEQDSIALVGNIGSSYWQAFSHSQEYGDGIPDPLDRWSARVANEISQEFAVTPIFPFEGPPYYPFQRWAGRAETLMQSPIGVMMHPEHGLWHSYRFALLGEQFEYELPQDTESPCLLCEDQPCLHRCPVDALDALSYDVDLCADYLIHTPQAACHETGCIARYACPVAPQYRYLPEQGQFHLRAFLGARLRTN
ncbi:MAG: hypothetical protein AAF353_04965 [Pseudomonadota bacterium]